MKRLFAFDLVILAYIAIITGVVVIARPDRMWIYLAYHAAFILFMGLIIGAHARYGGRFWTFLRYWYVILALLAPYRELHYLVPEVHPFFPDYRCDRALAALDLQWLGDVDGFFLSILKPGWTDFLYLCYWAYYAFPLVLGVALYRRGENARMREFTTALLAALFLSYLGYLVVPAIGPHHFYRPRPAVLDGAFLGGPLHALMLKIEWEMPDAFPSGHTLVSLTVLAMAWRHHRRTFRWLVVPVLGCVLATMALRYHYVVDVAAGMALLPAALLTGVRGNAAWERRMNPEDRG